MDEFSHRLQLKIMILTCAYNKNNLLLS